MRAFFTLVIVFFLPLLLVGQSALQNKVSLSLVDTPLDQALLKLGEKGGFHFSYASALLQSSESITLIVQDQTVETILQEILAPFSVDYKQVGNQIVIFQTPKRQTRKPTYIISGYIHDNQTGELLHGAHIFTASLEGTSTNESGFFSLTLPTDTIQLNISFLGYKLEKKTVHLKKDTRLVIGLEPSAHLKEVLVTDYRSEFTIPNSPLPSSLLSEKEITSLPMLGGEVDLIKALQLLPGVQAGNEGTSGLIVRGGGQDQNLILLDDAPVYYPNHLFGIFSVFNYPALGSVRFIKDGFPARYGGRLSSVLDIRTKEGDFRKWGGEIGIGLTAGSLLLEGPLVEDKTSLLLSFRRSYLDVFMKPISEKVKGREGIDGQTEYGFYDMNAKLVHRFSNKDQIRISYFRGNDNYEDQESFDYQLDYPIRSNRDIRMSWQNETATVAWMHEFSPRLFSRTSLIFSNFGFNFFEQNQYIESLPGFEPVVSTGVISYLSGINDITGRLDFDLIPHTDHYLRFGLNVTRHQFQPGTNTAFNQESEIDTTFNPKIYNSVEFSAYVEDDFKIGQRVKLNAGLHFSGHGLEGKYFGSVQPRISLSYLVHPNWTLKGSFSTMTQYIHLLTNTGLGLPTDLWIPTTGNLKPQQSIQMVGGFSGNLGKGWTLGMDIYYKSFNNLVTYLNESRFLLTAEQLDQNLTTGNGRSYGSEFILARKMGPTTGWVSYTLSRSERKFDGINNGEIFPFKYDRRHDISLAIFHKFNKNFEISGVWTYGTGNAVTLPVGEYPVINPGSETVPFIVLDYEDRNNSRLPAFHRLDLSLNYRVLYKQGEHLFNLSVYNAYNRQNPFFITIRENPDDPAMREFTQVTLFPIIPSFRYTIKF